MWSHTQNQLLHLPLAHCCNFFWPFLLSLERIIFLSSINLFPFLLLLLLLLQEEGWEGLCIFHLPLLLLLLLLPLLLLFLLLPDPFLNKYLFSSLSFSLLPFSSFSFPSRSSLTTSPTVHIVQQKQKAPIHQTKMIFCFMRVTLSTGQWEEGRCLQFGRDG